MRARRSIAVLVVALAGSLSVLAQAPAPTPANSQVADALLDRLQGVFDRMGTVEEGALGEELSNLARDSRASLQQGVFDKAFHARFARLLRVVRLAMITDTGDILADIVNRELVAFVRDVTGKAYDPSAGASEQIVMFSDAVASELAQLHAQAKRLR